MILDRRGPAASATQPRLLPMLVSLHLGEARVGRWHWLLEELALAFAIGHARPTGEGHWRGKLRGQAAVAAGAGPVTRHMLGEKDRGCPYFMMQADLVKRVQEVCRFGTGEIGDPQLPTRPSGQPDGQRRRIAEQHMSVMLSFNHELWEDEEYHESQRQSNPH